MLDAIGRINAAGSARSGKIRQLIALRNAAREQGNRMIGASTA